MPPRYRDRHPGFRTGFFADPSARAMGANLELFGLRGTRSEFPIEISLSPLTTKEGILVTSAIRDISEPAAAEAALEESHRFAKRIAETMPSIPYVYDMKAERNIFVNSRVPSVLGYAPEKIQIRSRLSLGSPSGRLAPGRPGQRAISFGRGRHRGGGRISHEARQRRVALVHSRATVFTRDSDGTPCPILAPCRTSRAQAAQQEVLEIAAQSSGHGEELHDDTGQELTGLCMLADNLTDALTNHTPDEAQGARHVAQGLHHVLGQIRRLSRGLIPVEVDAEGFMAALTELVDAPPCTRCSCTFDCVEPVPVEDNFAATHLYRIAQEAITNALKHGKAGNIRVNLETRERLDYAPRDHRCGIGLPNTERTPEGVGLRIMSIVPARSDPLSVRPGPRRGVVVTCTLFRWMNHSNP